MIFFLSFVQFFFFKLLPKFSDFINSDDYAGKITSEYIRLQPVFFSKKDLKITKNRFFSSEKLEIQVIVYMTMHTRSSERNFNPMRYTSIICTQLLFLNIYIHTYRNATSIVQIQIC